MEIYGNGAAAVKIPIILDTDIGSDIDDTWALAMLLNSPELDVRLITTTRGDTTYRARLVARLLEVGRRTDIPIGVGIYTKRNDPISQEKWITNYALEQYPGTVHKDGVAALIDEIRNSPRMPTLIAIGPLGNIAEALRRDPSIAPRCRFVGMDGSVRRGYNGSPTPSPECNVVSETAASQAVFAAPWASMTITPVDTCGLVRLTGADYQAVVDSPAPLARAVIENYQCWLDSHPGQRAHLAGGSSILFDTVAIHLAYTTRHLTMEELGIRVDDKGMTLIDPAARKVRVATEWTDQAAFQRELVRRVTR